MQDYLSATDAMNEKSGVPTDPEAGAPSHLHFPVVGLGASAGGLVL